MVQVSRFTCSDPRKAETLHPVDVARFQFAEMFTAAIPPVVALAPGRVNLIGEHTDYNDGYVLPMALDRGVAVAFAPRNDPVLRVCSAVFGETRAADIRELEPSGEAEWFDYVAAVVWAMREEGMGVGGIDVSVAGNVPVGAGLASSAALETAVARAMCHASSIKWDPVRMAGLCQRAENSYVGVNCGIMDQFAASVCAAGSALLLDCQTLEYSFVPIPCEAKFVVMDTGVRRSLITSEYNDRRRSCEAAVAAINRFDPHVHSLRDVDQPTLDSARQSLDAKAFRRAQHVVSEIHRPVQMADALRVGDLGLAGKLMDRSHASLRDLYEVSCPELDYITDLARGHAGCFGARMTGAGFGGCAVALVARDRVRQFVSDIAETYSAGGGKKGAMYVSRPSAGAAII